MADQTRVKTEKSILAARLEETNKCRLLLEKYRKFVVNKCQCCQRDDVRVEFSELEEEYQSVARSECESESRRAVKTETVGDFEINRRIKSENDSKERIKLEINYIKSEFEVKPRVKIETNSDFNPNKRIKIEPREEPDCELSAITDASFSLTRVKIEREIESESIHSFETSMAIENTNEEPELEFNVISKNFLINDCLSRQVRVEINANDVVLAKSGKQCARDSFDRFDSYFCERVFTYLSVNDCFKYECVSKLWSSLVFSHQKKLDIGVLIKEFRSKKDVNRNEGLRILETVMKKYGDIDDIVIRCYRLNDRMVDIISQSVHSLKSIVLKTAFISKLSANSWQQFCEKFGPNLQSFKVDYKWMPEDYSAYENRVKTMFQFTPNLIECQIEDLSQCIRADDYDDDDCDEFLPKLKSITARLCEKENEFREFADQYSKRVEKLSIFAPYNEELYFSLFKQLSRLERLQTLSVDFYSNAINESVKSGVKLLAKKCKNLRELTLSGADIFYYIFNMDSNSGQQFSSSLTRLTLIDTNRANINDVQYLACFPNLRELELRGEQIKTLNLDRIHEYVPKLRSFALRSSSRLKYHTLLQLTRLEELVSIRVELVRQTSFTVTQILDEHLCALIDGCLNLRRVTLPAVLSVSMSTLNHLIARAERQPRHHFLLRTVVRRQVYRDCLTKTVYDLTRNILPKNLEFDIKFENN